MTKDTTISERIKQQATEWHTLMNSGCVDEEVKAKFEGWLHADSAHKQAYHDLEQIWRDLDFFALAAGVDLTDTRPPGVFETWRHRLKGWIVRPSPLPVGGLLAGVAALFFVGLNVSTSSVVMVDEPVPAYTTELAQLEEITLEDGSVVTLGAKSQMDVSFTPDSRQVTLLSGEAFFDVAKDPERPFFVAMDDTLIRVVGTKFDVKKTTGDVHVSVLEGKVAVMQAATISKEIIAARTEELDAQLLTAGQKMVASKSVDEPEVQDIERTVPGAWRSGRLAYDNASLNEIVADVNRYSARTIAIADSEIGEIRFTMGFGSDEIEQWLEVLEASHPVEIVDRGYGDIIIRQKS